jgi:phosphate:Na+ symporter
MASSILSSLGGLGLFLLGLVVMTGGLKEMAGDSIRRTIARFTTSPLSGVATGAVLTALVRSSSTTTVTAVGFAGAGLLTLSQALGIIFGANLGTTVTGWIVALFGFKYDITALALPLILVGTVIHLLGKGRGAAAGIAIAGFGLVFVGIDALQNGMSGMTEVVTPASFPDDTWLGRLLLVFMGIGITLVTQSSSAGVAMALTAVHAGAISFPQAAAMVIGFDVGTTVTAGIAGLSGSIEARRVGFAHVIYNIITGIGAYFLLTPYVWCCDALVQGGAQGNAEFALVGFHTVFNGLGVLLALPFTERFARLIEWLIPQRDDELVRRLDRSLYENPSVAMLAAHAVTVDAARQLLQLLKKQFAASGRPPQPEPYGRFRDTLASISQYLNGISVKEDQSLMTRLEHAFLAIDHLRRLSYRCENWQRLDPTRDDPLLVDYAAAVRGELETVLAALDAPLSKETQWAAKSQYKEFATRDDADRQHFSEAVARGEVDPVTAIARLDSLRWLRRISYHLWRIVRHLRHVQFQQPAHPQEVADADRENHPPPQEDLAGPAGQAEK